MGYLPVGLVETGRTLALTALLFLGPLFEKGVVEGAWRDWIRLRGLDEVVGGWIGYRNIVAVSNAHAIYRQALKPHPGPSNRGSSFPLMRRSAPYTL